jgi:hypothetical protein
MLSRPIVETTSPMKPVNNPFIGDFPETPTIMVKPKSATTAYSAGPKRSANSAIGKAKNIRHRELDNPPTTENTVFILRAIMA